MEENGCCFDNYYNKKKVKLQLIEDNRLNKHPESHGFFIPTYKLCVIFQLSAIANSYFMIWPAIWVNAQAGVMGGKYQKLFWSIKEKYDLTSAVWSEFEVVSEFFKKKYVCVSWKWKFFTNWKATNNYDVVRTLLKILNKDLFSNYANFVYVSVLWVCVYECSFLQRPET